MSAQQKLLLENIGQKIGLCKQKPSLYGSKKLKMSVVKQLINNLINIEFEFESYNTIPLGFVTTNPEAYQQETNFLLSKTALTIQKFV